jgi:poly(A) polymerase
VRYRDRALIAWAAAVAGGGAAAPHAAEAWVAVLKSGAEWAPPRFPLKGRDAVKLGVPPGPAVGRLMAALEDWWIAGDFEATREACLAELRQRAAAVAAP